MLPRIFRIVFAGVLALGSGAAFAQPAQADPRLPQVRAAIQAAELGQFNAAQYGSLSGHPLYGWIEYAALRRDIDTLPDAQGQAFLSRYKGQAVAAAFRELWLAALSRREDWRAFRAAWSPQVQATALRCAELNARQAAGGADAQWTNDAQALWRALGSKPAPKECAAPFTLLAAKGGLPPALRWERFDQATDDWNAAVMREAARGLPAEQYALASDYASFMEAVNERALSWPKTERSRRVASQGLARLGKSVPVAAEAQLPKYAQALGFSEADRGRVLYQVALWTVASYEPESARRLAAVPASSYDDRLHEWQVREALARSDWPAALAAIRAMGAKQRSDSRWTYFEARLLELTGDKAGAQAAYGRAAQVSEFHGFLAADRIDAPYALCPWLPHDSDAAKAAVARDPAIVRAMGLYRIDRSGWAQREWDEALSRFDDNQRRMAVEVAQDNGWFDRAVFSLGKTPDERRLYELRFPLHHDATIRREAAKNGLDPAWVAAEIRAESVFNPDARSGANAMGLMQVLPGTGMQVARRLGLPWGGAQSLYDPDTNIILGTAYLRQMLDKYGGKPYFAIAGYNAGPTPLQRWQSQRPGMDPDFWIETISYKETRDYVARVLAFSTLYDWRLNGNAVPLGDRMRGVTGGTRKQFTCALAKPEAATTAR
ncbi:lytic transglycosylase domain-containing protein [Luteimonas sp. 50]|uniref:Lytic transglycosylase domain-containing protein n=1 Tax=Cognatiluteimonas sedimenti TaxID=2927791 RepID=A0ABT0A6B0_9GAMM|nr:lytic transglycosylase domain-containing protein [Lysobacter sedimenti]MCJ0826517.1 lytic transglycosylase domain-containing protein [Lysobacter sedimenti]